MSCKLKKVFSFFEIKNFLSNKHATSSLTSKKSLRIEGRIRICVLSNMNPFLINNLIEFAIIPSAKPFHPAWITPKKNLSAKNIGKQSAVLTSNIKSLFEVNIPSQFSY